jgi:glyoxylase-like metal-dependent hydrolase (beta-lactamase superfamily II)
VNTTLEHLHAIQLPTPFPVGPITVYLADAPHEPLTLIDTGPHTAETRRALGAALAARGYRLGDLERIIVTHAHLDHFGLAGYLVKASGAAVWTHPWNVPTLGDYEADRRRRMVFYEEMLRRAAVPAGILAPVEQMTQDIERYGRPVAVAVPCDEGDRLELAGRTWQVLHAPGHSAGLICLYDSQARILVASDHLLAAISSNPVLEPPPPGHRERLRSLVHYQQSLQRVAALPVALALPSHGPAIDDVAWLVEQRLAFHGQRLQKIVEALAVGARTTWDVTCALFGRRDPFDTFLAVSEVIAHLDVLEMSGRVAAEEQGGVLLWRLLEDRVPGVRGKSAKKQR